MLAMLAAGHARSWLCPQLAMPAVGHANRSHAHRSIATYTAASSFVPSTWPSIARHFFRRGGTAGALVAMTAALQIAGEIFEQQLGVLLRVRHVVLNIDAKTHFNMSGPNDAPAGAPNSRSCPSYAPIEYPPAEPYVRLDGLNIALGRMSQWVGLHSERVAGERLGAWLMLTNCFPIPGAVGVAPVGAVCDRGSDKIHFVDSGKVAGASDLCTRLLSTGNCATMQNAAAGSCGAADLACLASVAVASDSAGLWQTVGHELGHVMGGEHTFSKGGLMAYSGERAFYDNHDICPYLNRVRRGPSNCFRTSAPRCGDGELGIGEECDDGNTAPGDGCNAGCHVECGWLCEERFDLDGFGASNCSLGCGNGVVEAHLGEQCDSDEPCCNGCRFAPGWLCCGECCVMQEEGGEVGGNGTSGAQRGLPKPTTASCAGGDGVCVDGECVTTLAHCKLYSNTIFNPRVCPIMPEKSCLPRCHIIDSAEGFLPCHSPEGFDANFPSTAFPNGTACTTLVGEDGKCYNGQCLRFVALLTVGSCGNGIVEGAEECDDASPCCTRDCRCIHCLRHSSCSLSPNISSRVGRRHASAPSRAARICVLI